MDEIAVGQRYLARPEFAACDTASFNKSGKPGPQLAGTVIHVGRRGRTATLEFTVRMGRIRETIWAENLGKRIG